VSNSDLPADDAHEAASRRCSATAARAFSGLVEEQFDLAFEYKKRVRAVGLPGYGPEVTFPKA
jgi:hypothetical protein